MTVTVTNLLSGPADLYIATFGAAEPATAVTAPTTPTPWRDLGATQGGLKQTVSKKYFQLDVDQIVLTPESRIQGIEIKMATNLAEITLENLAASLNELAASVTTVTNEKKFSMGLQAPGVPENYVALLMDGRAPSGKRRRVIMRRCLQIGDVEQANAKDGQTFLPVEFMAHYVSSSIAPVYYVDDVTP
jgi:hypothetical protein